ncbi:MAG: efflux RND transporter periplasmic adaptor subunit [Nitrospirae bacterium]|nr:efflux RND transporter periplasmic adaptor subunit [Nitrospirota bacterium]
MKKIGIGMIAAVIGGIILFYLLQDNGEDAKFKTVKISRGDIQEAVTATGTVNAVTTVQVGTQVSGTIKQIYVDFNSPVKKGRLIAEIDPALLEAQVGQSRANVLTAKANLAKAQAALLDAKRTMDRYRELVSKGLIARSDLDTAETNYETARAQVVASESELMRTEAASTLSETNLKYTKIVSPVDGIVVSRSVDVGQTVAASFQTPTLFTIAQDLTKMQIVASVDEADIGKVKEGQDVEFTVDAYPDVPFKGKVWQIRNAPVTVENVVTYAVVIQVDNTDLKLKPGMTANVTIVTAVKKDVFKVPSIALRYKPSADEAENKNPREQQKGPGIWVLEQGKPKRVNVKPGISDGNNMEVFSDELKEGQEVITSSLSGSGKSSNNNSGRPPGFF